jgi:anaerobic selenocysteine-containing dehydrogenase
VNAAIDSVLDPDHPWLKGIDRTRLEREGHVRLNFHHGDTETRSPDVPFLPFADGEFFTPSGKAQFYDESLTAKGLDPVLAFSPPAESRHGPAARSYPLELLPRKADNFLNSTFTNLPAIQEMEDRHLLEMTVADAAARGINNGDRVRVFNERGEIELTARVNGSVPAGVVAARLDWAKLSPEGKNINVLTSDRLTDIGSGATFYSTLVEVERASSRVAAND